MPDADLAKISAMIQSRIRELSNAKPNLPDTKEMGERTEASIAYAHESPKHFVDYGVDAVRTSINHMRKIREVQRECLKVYYEEDPPNYTRKEKWQSKVVLPKPHAAVQFAMAGVRKAFNTDFVSIQNESNSEAADLWTKVMKHYLDRSHANFPVHFTDAAGMGFAVGQSMEMIPVWRPGFGLKYILVEPWKIHRDPDAFGREPQSGMYWVHQEYLDYHVIREAEKQGRYVNTAQVQDYASAGDNTSSANPLMTQQQIQMRKDMIWARSVFRKSVLTSEFWGMILSPRGEKLLDNATYTWAGDTVIGLPKPSPYNRLRWPGISFSPLPHFLRFDGRGLLHGVRSLWYFMCSLAALHNDYLNWIVNPMLEITLPLIMDQEDLTTYPGKPWLVRETNQGQEVVRTVDRKAITGDVMAYLNFGDQAFQKGTMINDTIQGLPGFRAEVTARENAQNLEQSDTVVTLMANNLEDGAIWAIQAGAETIQANAGVQDLQEIFKGEDLGKYIDLQSSTGIRLPLLNGSFHVDGITAIMKDQDTLKTIMNVILPLFDQTKFGDMFKPYLRPGYLIKAINRCANLIDQRIVVDDAKIEQIDKMQQDIQDKAIGQKEALEQQAADAKTQAANAQLAASQAGAQAQQPTPEETAKAGAETQGVVNQNANDQASNAQQMRHAEEAHQLDVSQSKEKHATDLRHKEEKHRAAVKNLMAPKGPTTKS